MQFYAVSWSVVVLDGLVAGWPDRVARLSEEGEPFFLIEFEHRFATCEESPEDYYEYTQPPPPPEGKKRKASQLQRGVQQVYSDMVDTGE